MTDVLRTPDVGLGSNLEFSKLKSTSHSGLWGLPARS